MTLWQVLGKIGKTIRQSLLSFNMIGVEAAVTMEVILMIANIETLGVPVQYSSLPVTVAAAVCAIIIPGLGFIMDNWATTKKGKAIVLVSVNCLQIVGAGLVLVGNLIKLFKDNDDLRSELNATTSFPAATLNFEESTTLRHNYSTKFDGGSFPALVTEHPKTESVNIRYYAILVMIGFAMIDCGYDSTNCILKTFSLACTPLQKHESNILRSIFVSSLGGCLMSALVSVGVGDLLTAGTNHDSNASQTAFLSALSLLLVLVTMSCTLLAGFCCPPTLDDSTYKRIKDENDDETSHLIPDSSQLNKSNLSVSQRTWIMSHSGSLHIEDFEPVLPTSDPFPAETIHVADSNTLPSRRGNKVFRFLKDKKKYIILNIASFFYFGGLYSFEVFSVNFVGVSVFQGDPYAKSGTEEYSRYIEGIQVGSQGTLTFYIAFTIFSAVLEPIIDRVGMKLLFLSMSAAYIATCVACAVTALLPIYFITAVFTGIFRSVVFSVPFILANKFSKQDSIRNNTQYNSGLAIAAVATMLPCGFTLCCALMGPLIDATDATAPIYYTAANVFVGSIWFFFLKTSTE